MKDDCPHGGISLKLRLLRAKTLPGERRLLPDRTNPACPDCGGRLAPNTHWSETAANVMVCLPLLCFLSARTDLSLRSAAGLAHGGRDDGQPGLRPPHHAHYY